MINKPTFGIQKLANSKSCLEEENPNKEVVIDLYKAIVSKDTNKIHSLLATDLEWWFHGPSCHRHHLVPFLTGSSSSSSSPNHLIPNHIIGFGSVIVAEGYDEVNLVWWVHAWTTSNGIITEVREYLNTSVTVTRLGLHASSTWHSMLCDGSVPGLILAI